MNRLIRSLLAVVLIAGVVACSRVTPENYAKLETGMSRDDVYALLGQPDEISGGGVGKLTMSREIWRGREHRIAITFTSDTLAIKSIDTAAAAP